MLPKDITSYGGPYADYAAVENPENELAADYGNRLLEDTGQLTQTGMRAMVRFLTVSGGALPLDIPVGNISHWTVWGSGPGTRPLITKSAQGRYTIRFAASYLDGLGVTENVVFLDGQSGAMSSDPVDDVDARIIELVSNIVHVKALQTNAAPPVIHDVGNNSGNPFYVSVWLR